MNNKLSPSRKLLTKAYNEYLKDTKNELKLASLAKCFEVCFEYTWKDFKNHANQAGLEVYSPRDAIKAAAQLNLINNLEKWNQVLNARNLSVHNYLGIEDENFLEVISFFITETKDLLEK